MPPGGTKDRSKIRFLFDHPELGSLGRSVGIASLVGIAAGLAAIGFEFLIHLVRHDVLAEPLGLVGEGVGTESSFPWTVLLVPTIGGLLAGLLITRFAPEAEGHGTEALVRSFHQTSGRVRARLVAVKALASALTIGSGGSAGQEGPVAQIGSGVGANLANAVGLSDRDRRIFLLAGASAGISAMFSAPLGAALFAPEVLYRKPEFESDAIIPCIIASIVAYTTRSTLGSDSPPVPIEDSVLAALQFGDIRELPAYLLLALACTVVGWIYYKVFHLVHAGFERLDRVPRWVRPGIGGLCLGALAVAIAPLVDGHGVFFGGYQLMLDSVLGSIGVTALCVLILAKILATSFSIGSGGSGGLFAPSLAIGALLGSLVGRSTEVFGTDPAAFALVGMGGFFAGVAKTPVAATIIVCEITGGYSLLAPLMLVSVVHMLLANRWTIYDSQVEGMVESPAHAGEFVVDVLERMRVGDVIDRNRRVTLVSQNATLRKALDTVSTAKGSYFPVIDDSSNMVGIFSLSDVRRIFRESGVEDLVIVRDFMVDRVATVTPDDDLNEALRKMNELSIAELPVVESTDEGKVVAMLSRNNVGAAYHRRLQELRKAPMVRN